ncbi:MAG: Diaminopimelate epimerase [Pseudomonas sp.]|nr:MAG: Diaminopimelate epimerase [Pseudomonas sp.]
MALLYDARGNIYAVVSPDSLRRQGIDVPHLAADAARSKDTWAQAAIAAECEWSTVPRPSGAKAHRCDGLLVGPFQDRAPFDLLIVNTDGTLAERSGNGLTIFAQALTDQGLMNQACDLRVHHDKTDAISPVLTRVEPEQYEQAQGFWLTLGCPAFGALAVGATGPENHVAQLAALNPAWDYSQFVRVGNPHCVTLVQQASALPDFQQLHAAALFEPLQAIAFAPPAGAGLPCSAGVNLQWAAHEGGQRVLARVFERGEGPTASSGTSASAVACAAWRAGWVTDGVVAVVMPGGTAPVRLQAQAEELPSISLFGVARLQGQ